MAENLRSLHYSDGTGFADLFVLCQLFEILKIVYIVT